MPRDLPRRRRPGRPRRRPGRRPPDRYRGGGFTGAGTGAVYAMLMPLRGAAKRSFFNRASLVLALAAGYAGAGVGYELAGPAGAALGLGGGLAAGCTVLRRQGFHRG